MKTIVIGSCAAIVGLLVGGALTNKATAQQGSPRYEYKCFKEWPERIYTQEAIQRVNQMSQQGWRWMAEMRSGVTVNWDVYCFERRM
jgi:hypothetical protein